MLRMNVKSCLCIYLIAIGSLSYVVFSSMNDNAQPAAALRVVFDECLITDNITELVNDGIRDHPRFAVDGLL